jgi:IclR family transcriptional regulator, acetate operon repressor
MDVKTAGRTVEIFETFAETQEPLSLSEISRALDAPLSSCLYLVRALESRGYLYGVGARRQIYPTRKLHDVAKAIAAGESWLAQVEPALSKLRDASRETVLLGKRQGDRVVYVAVFEGTQTIRYSSQVGDIKPLHASSIGKALLTALDRPELEKLVKRLSLEAATPATLIDKEVLLEDIDVSRKRGYSLTRGEFVADVMAVGRPVRLAGDQYGIAVAGPLHRMEAAVTDHAKLLEETCAEIEENSKL